MKWPELWPIILTFMVARHAAVEILEQMVRDLPNYSVSSAALVDGNWGNYGKLSERMPRLPSPAIMVKRF